MAPTSIYFNGIFTRIPGSYSLVDASALDAVGIGASGIVACIGTAIGGKPVSAVDANDVTGTVQKSTRPGVAKDYFEYGSDLLEAESMLFNPSNDDDIQAGAQRVVWFKVNSSGQSAATFSNTNGGALTLTSAGYGFKTTQINVEIAAGTVEGKLYTITFEDTSEVFDDVLLEVFDIIYLASTPAQGFTTANLACSATALTSLFTRTQAGLDSDITNQVNVIGYAASIAIQVLSSDASDDQTVTLYGIDETGTAISEQVVVNGTTPVTTTELFQTFLGGFISAAPTGTVTVRNISGTAITTFTSVILTRGLGIASDMPAASVIAAAADGFTTKRLLVIGAATNGAALMEAVTLNSTTQVATTAVFSRIDYFAMGLVQAARTVTFSGTAVACPFNAYDTLKKCSDLFNSKGGMTFTMVYGEQTFAMTNMDTDIAAQNILSPANPSFYANLYWAITTINNGSQLVVATRASGGTGAPDNTTAAVYLAGGHEGDALSPTVVTATNSDWQAAYDLAQKMFINTIVPLSSTPAIHAIHDAHLVYMAGAGRQERDGLVGVQNAGQTGLATKAEIKSQIVAINSRHTRVCGQNVERYDSAGTLTAFAPYYQACVGAGMQAGSPVAVSLTRKYKNVVNIYNHSSWHPKDDADEMIEMGLFFAEQIDGVGIQWVRNITSNVSSSNVVYTEAEVNEAANYSVYNFRTAMEWAVGRQGFEGTEQAAEGVAENVLDQLVGVSLTSYRSLSVELVVQTLEVSVEMAPVLSIVFVENTIHLVTS